MVMEIIKRNKILKGRHFVFVVKVGFIPMNLNPIGIAIQLRY
jgi:hypothetical protein